VHIFIKERDQMRTELSDELVTTIDLRMHTSMAVIAAWWLVCSSTCKPNSSFFTPVRQHTKPEVNKHAPHQQARFG
jgi:hypothetical protein